MLPSEKQTAFPAAAPKLAARPGRRQPPQRWWTKLAVLTVPHELPRDACAARHKSCCHPAVYDTSL